MKNLLLTILSSLALLSCKNNSSLEEKYENHLTQKLNSLIQSNNLTKEEASLIDKYIDASKYDSTYLSANGKSLKEILALAKERIKKDNVIIDTLKINNTKNTVSAQSTVICSNQPTPQGYVITSYGNSMSCPGWTPGGMNTKIISLPTNNMSVCSSSPIPNGYVVVGYGNSMSCPGWTPSGQNTKIIRKL